MRLALISLLMIPVAMGSEASDSATIKPNTPLTVVLVADDDTLNVRAGASAREPVLTTLKPGSSTIQTTGRKKLNGSTPWVEISNGNGGTGWVAQRYVAEAPPIKDFCGDPEVTALIKRFRYVMLSRDSNGLAKIVSPVHGFTVRHNWWNTPVRFTGGAALTDYGTKDWGVQDGSALPIRGSFMQKIYPYLKSMLQSESVPICGEIPGGPSAGYVKWPDDWSGFATVSFHSRGSGHADWSTWTIGITWLDEKPHVTALTNYHWEI